MPAYLSQPVNPFTKIRRLYGQKYPHLGGDLYHGRLLQNALPSSKRSSPASPLTYIREPFGSHISTIHSDADFDGLKSNSIKLGSVMREAGWFIPYAPTRCFNTAWLSRSVLDTLLMQWSWQRLTADCHNLSGMADRFFRP